MHLSGILVTTKPGRFERCRAELDAMPGVEVHHCDPPSGRMIAVIESATVDEQIEGLRRIQELPEVEFAALVEHRVDRAPAGNG